MIYKRGGHWHLDVTVNGVRYREALHTSDRREALSLEKKRVAEIHQGKGASKAGREFARLPFSAAADLFCEERKPHVSPRTAQLDKERLRPLRQFFGETPLLRVKASDVNAYQRARLSGEIRLKVSGVEGACGVGNRTVNMEVTVLRQMMRRAKMWSVVSEDVKMLPERHAVVGRVLSREHKELLFRTAGSRQAWSPLRGGPRRLNDVPRSGTQESAMARCGPIRQNYGRPPLEDRRGHPNHSAE